MENFIFCAVLLKNHVSYCFILKYYITTPFWQFTKTLKQFFPYLGQSKIWKFACLFDLCNWMDQSSFEVLLLKSILVNGHYLRNTKQRFFENCCMWGYHFQMTVTLNEAGTVKTSFGIPVHCRFFLIFPEAISCR